MKQDVELLEARRDLERFLDQLPTGNDYELIELLVDMNREGALSYRWDEYKGLPIRLWHPLAARGETGCFHAATESI